ncbi:hypothetical protein EVAR_38132_1 [Eumeta japonica]|uniref:malate dehydrogenase n=1 Tax=Eumeta variegata TaxID=151549 RepID=A0A4C1YQZ5_EUMVA|nr:hypothetical protein EVAR_38132_1 [Eumeta japonica]
MALSRTSRVRSKIAAYRFYELAPGWLAAFCLGGRPLKRETERLKEREGARLAMDLRLDSGINSSQMGNNDINLHSPALVQKEGYVRVTEAEYTRDHRDKNNQQTWLYLYELEKTQSAVAITDDDSQTHCLVRSFGTTWCDLEMCLQVLWELFSLKKIRPRASRMEGIKEQWAAGTSTHWTKRNSESCYFESVFCENSDIVVFLETFHVHPEMTVEKRFYYQAPIVKRFTEAIAGYCPQAFLLVCTTPIECMVPLVAERARNSRRSRSCHQIGDGDLQQPQTRIAPAEFAGLMNEYGWYNPCKIMGCMASMELRASNLAAQALGLDPYTTRVPCICGTEGSTLIPLYSRTVDQFEIYEQLGAARSLEALTDLGFDIDHNKLSIRFDLNFYYRGRRAVSTCSYEARPPPANLALGHATAALGQISNLVHLKLNLQARRPFIRMEYGSGGGYYGTRSKSWIDAFRYGEKRH